MKGWIARNNQSLRSDLGTFIAKTSHWLVLSYDGRQNGTSSVGTSKELRQPPAWRIKCCYGTTEEERGVHDRISSGFSLGCSPIDGRFPQTKLPDRKKGVYEKNCLAPPLSPAFKTWNADSPVMATSVIERLWFLLQELRKVLLEPRPCVS